MRKMLSFTPQEWATVETRMKAAGARSFESFAREAVVDGSIRVVRYAVDVSEIRGELSRIGNNVNQIARSVNMADGATREQLTAVRALLGQVQAVLVRASKGEA